MADTEYYKIILNKLVRPAVLSCDPETLEQIGGHQPSTALPLEGTAEKRTVPCGFCQAGAEGSS